MAIDKKRATANQQQHLQSVLLNLIMVSPFYRSSAITVVSWMGGGTSAAARCFCLMPTYHEACAVQIDKSAYLINLDGTSRYLQNLKKDQQRKQLHMLYSRLLCIQKSFGTANYFWIAKDGK